jgi:hypothetical protein
MLLLHLLGVGCALGARVDIGAVLEDLNVLQLLGILHSA